MQALITKIAESYNPAYGQNRKAGASAGAVKYRLTEGFFTPILAPLLKNRWLNCVFVGFGAAQLVLVFTVSSGWQCPIYAILGKICPGCGMTTAMAMLLKGHWQIAFRTHVFAPVILVIWVMMLIAIWLPPTYLTKLSGIVERLEKKSGITAILLLSMLSYWLLRVFEFI